MYYKVKFFGSKSKKEQIKQVKTLVNVPTKADVEEYLRHQEGYEVINNLKIREYEEQ